MSGPFDNLDDVTVIKTPNGPRLGFRRPDPPRKRFPSLKALAGLLCLSFVLIGIVGAMVNPRKPEPVAAPAPLLPHDALEPVADTAPRQGRAFLPVKREKTEEVHGYTNKNGKWVESYNRRPRN